MSEAIVLPQEGEGHEQPEIEEYEIVMMTWVTSFEPQRTFLSSQVAVGDDVPNSPYHEENMDGEQDIPPVIPNSSSIAEKLTRAYPRVSNLSIHVESLQTSIALIPTSLHPFTTKQRPILSLFSKQTTALPRGVTALSLLMVMASVILYLLVMVSMVDEDNLLQQHSFSMLVASGILMVCGGSLLLLRYDSVRLLCMVRCIDWWLMVIATALVTCGFSGVLYQRVSTENLPRATIVFIVLFTIFIPPLFYCMDAGPFSLRVRRGVSTIIVILFAIAYFLTHSYVLPRLYSPSVVTAFTNTFEFYITFSPLQSIIQEYLSVLLMYAVKMCYYQWTSTQENPRYYLFSVGVSDVGMEGSKEDIITMRFVAPKGYVESQDCILNLLFPMHDSREVNFVRTTLPHFHEDEKTLVTLPKLSPLLNRETTLLSIPAVVRKIERYHKILFVLFILGVGAGCYGVITFPYPALPYVDVLNCVCVILCSSTIFLCLTYRRDLILRVMQNMDCWFIVVSSNLFVLSSAEIIHECNNLKRDYSYLVVLGNFFAMNLLIPMDASPFSTRMRGIGSMVFAACLGQVYVFSLSVLVRVYPSETRDAALKSYDLGIWTVTLQYVMGSNVWVVTWFAAKMAAKALILKRRYIMISGEVEDVVLLNNFHNT